MLDVDGTSLIALVDVSYDQRGEYTAWAERLLHVLASLTAARSAAALRMKSFYDAQGALRVRDAGDFVCFGPEIAYGGRTREAVENQPAAEVSFGRTHAETVSASTGMGDRVALAPGFRDCWLEPVVDSLGLISRDAQGDIFCISVGLDVVTRMSQREARLLTRLATHLGAGDRLRRLARPDIEDAEAILSPTGKVLHAAEAAEKRLDAVEEGRQRRAEARRTKHDPEKALEIWRGLVAGRWSLVDHFDTDGKRFILAMKNTPAVDPRANLTAHERRAAALAAMGHRDKEIAYMLGVSTASIVAALHRARKKLGVASRTELAATWRRRKPSPDEEN